MTPIIHETFGPFVPASGEVSDMPTRSGEPKPDHEAMDDADRKQDRPGDQEAPEAIRQAGDDVRQPCAEDRDEDENLEHEDLTFVCA